MKLIIPPNDEHDDHWIHDNCGDDRWCCDYYHYYDFFIVAKAKGSMALIKIPAFLMSIVIITVVIVINVLLLEHR